MRREEGHREQYEELQESRSQGGQSENDRERGKKSQELSDLDARGGEL